MTNRQRFFVNGIMLTLVGIAMRSVSIGFNAFITQTVGAEGMGLFSLIGSIYAFAVTFASAGISLTVTRLVSAAIGEKKENEIRRILRSAVLYAFIFSIFASVVLFSFSKYFANTVLSDARAVEPLRILSLSLVPLALSSVLSGYFIGLKKVGKNALTQIVCQVFRIAVTTILVLRFASQGVLFGTVGLCIGITLTEILCFAVSYIQFLFEKCKNNFIKTLKPKDHFNSVFGMAIPIALSAYIRSALLTIEHTIIPKRLRDGGESHERSIVLYGILHGMALPVLLYPMVTLSSFAGLLVPEFSESMAKTEDNRMRRITSNALNTTLVYATVSMVMLFLFSEEIGYLLYDSYDAGYYIALMCPVIPIMYLDHVTDSVLKGIGEHVYSMWVNISDSLLSVMLVWILIGNMGIGGYALVIVIMEGYNFILSIGRLYSKIKFKINLLSSFVIPLVSSLASALLSKHLFAISGESTTPVWLILRLVFALCMFFALYISFLSLVKYIFTKAERVNKSLRNRKNVSP